MCFVIVIIIILILFILLFCVKPHQSETSVDRYDIKKVESSLSQNVPSFKTTTFKIAGVTFKDGQKQRQTALRMLKFKDAPMDGPIMFEFEQYEFEGKNAVRIIANDRILGNVPANIVDEFISNITTHSDYDIDYKISGGGDYPYGCEMTFTWK